MKQTKTVIGIDIGGTKCAVLLGEIFVDNFEDKPRILYKERFPTEGERGWEDALRRIVCSIDAILERAKPVKLDAIGISCGGPLDSSNGVILGPPNLPGWDCVPIRDLLAEHYGVPVYLQNDANACALAEWRYGAARGTQNAVFLTFGTGLGAGLILNGRLYHGATDMAGEIGHVRLSAHGPVGYGKEGSWEGFCSGGGISQLAQTKILEQKQIGKTPELLRYCADGASPTAKEVARAAEDGEPLALNILQTTAVMLGRGLALLVDILNPEVIVIGSIFARCESILQPVVNRVLEEEVLEQTRSVLRVVSAGLGEEIGDYAALTAALGEE